MVHFRFLLQPPRKLYQNINIFFPVLLSFLNGPD
uniref:Uncharacterized protein n=1 Tax=Anguilla anguilla TaxID=7936 RepID=A0A0E9U6J1_ANGAN